MRPRARLTAAFATAVLVLTAAPALAQFPFPAPGPNVYDYTTLHITNGDCMPLAATETTPPGTDLPPGFNCRGDSKLTDYAPQVGESDYDPTVENNPQELFGVKGPGTNHAWEVTTGRPDTVISVMDSGILWNENTPELVNKFYLSRGELPVPSGVTKGGPLTAYDVNHDGVFNVKDYVGDSRVVDFPDDQNNYVDPGDLIRTFSDGIDDDANGYKDDIAGWDFFENDNNPSDDVVYGHGTGEARDSVREAGFGNSQCLDCMVMPLRVGDSFIADINHWAQAVVYAVDNGVSVVQEALGTLNHSGFAQAAADYAYNHGVLVVASEADESAGHHNYPAALNHTMVVNSVTHFADQGIPVIGDIPLQLPETYLAFNGCTNFGGYTWVSVESNSCSSDATGQSAGMAGLLYSAARNAVAHGVITPDVSGRPISAEEAKQLFRLGANDIDFSTPKKGFPPNNFFTTLPDSQRFVTTAGWDQISGWGRISSDALVHMVAAGQIPPEADVTLPRWWEPLKTTGTVQIVGRVAAPRALSYKYLVQYAPGVQPPRFPLGDTWTTVTTGTGSVPKTGVLATLDLAAIRQAITLAPPVYTPLDDPTSKDLPEKDAFRVRVVTCAGGTCPADLEHSTSVAIEQRQYFSSADTDLFAAFPKYLNADGGGSPAFDDLDGDGKVELILADGNGFVHAFKSNGTEATGWPVHTEALPLPASGVNGFTRGEISNVVYAPVLLGSPTVADLNGDGNAEVAVADMEGFVHVWDWRGLPFPGFPVTNNRAYSEEPGCQTNIGTACDDFTTKDLRDRVNTVDHAFTANPVAGDLDKSRPGLELLAGNMDDHVYAWHADGSLVAGWPVLLRDPAKVASVDPVTHKIAFKNDGNAAYGKQVISTPTLGDWDGDGQLDVAVNVDEEYNDAPNWTIRDPLLPALGAVAGSGNTRTYLLFHDGKAHPGIDRVPNLGDRAYEPGWPVAIGMVQTELLPDVGSGSDGAPVMADVDGDHKLEIATASIGSPPYLLKGDGTSFYGSVKKKYLTMASALAEFKSSANDGSSLASLGGGAFGKLAGKKSRLSFAMGSTGLRRLLDVVLPEQQLLAEDHIGAWNALTGTYEPGFPAQMNDLMFFNTPAIADVSGDGLAEILQASAMYDLRAYGVGGVPATGFPKFTGGWTVDTPGLGDLNGDGFLDVAIMTRDGNLFVWNTKGAACQTPEWPKYQHDLWNTGTYGTDAQRPGAVRDLAALATVLTWTAQGDDLNCGLPARYEIRYSASPITRTNFVSATLLPGGPTPLAAGTAQTFNVSGLPHGTWYVAVQAVDEVGNRGPASNAVVVVKI